MRFLQSIYHFYRFQDIILDIDTNAILPALSSAIISLSFSFAYKLSCFLQGGGIRHFNMSYTFHNLDISMLQYIFSILSYSFIPKSTVLNQFSLICNHVPRDDVVWPENWNNGHLILKSEVILLHDPVRLQPKQLFQIRNQLTETTTRTSDDSNSDGD